MDASKADLDCGREERSENVSDVNTLKDKSETCDLPRKIKNISEKVSAEINALKEVAKDCYQTLEALADKLLPPEIKISAIKTLMGEVPAQEVKGIRDDLDSTVNKVEQDLLDIRSTVNSFSNRVTIIGAQVHNILYHLDLYKLPKNKLKHNEIYHIYSPLKADVSETDTSYEDIENSSIDDDSVDETAV